MNLARSISTGHYMLLFAINNINDLFFLSYFKSICMETVIFTSAYSTYDIVNFDVNVIEFTCYMSRIPPALQISPGGPLASL
jgi:hypothetical protein